MKKMVAMMFAVILVLAPSAFSAEYEIDGVHSTALFTVSHLGFSNTRGLFPAIAGTFNYDADDASANSVDVTIQTDSLTTLHEDRDMHLKGPDFFNAKEFPVMTFKSTKWEKTGEGKFDVTGEFTLLGTTKTITVPVVLVGAGEGMKGEQRAGFETTFTIDRTDYGMNYMADKLAHDVIVTFGVEGSHE